MPQKIMHAMIRNRKNMKYIPTFSKIDNLCVYTIWILTKNFVLILDQLKFWKKHIFFEFVNIFNY